MAAVAGWRRRWQAVALTMVLVLTPAVGVRARPPCEPDPADVATEGVTPWMVLRPGRVVVLEGGDDRVAITVLPETRKVGPYLARVVEEREWHRGRLVEVSRNFLAIVRSTGDVLYLGEEVDRFRGARVTGHEGSWLAYRDGALPGVLLPGRPVAGEVFEEERAPGVAADRGEVLATDAVVRTPAGRYTGCLLVLETSALDPRDVSVKAYAPGVGLVLDDALRAVAVVGSGHAR